MGDDPDSENTEGMMQQAIKKMEPVIRNTFVELLNFMGEVASYEQYNKMNVDNLARIMAPNLFRPYEMT